MSLSTALVLAFHGLMVATLAFAWIAGGRAERAGVLLVAGMAAFSWLSQAISYSRFATIDPLALVQDFVGFAGFMYIGLRARRFWPLWAAAMQLLSLAAHFARGLKSEVDPMVYALMKSVPTLVVCLAIAAGAALYRRRRRVASSRGSAGSACQASWKRHSPD